LKKGYKLKYFLFISLFLLSSLIANEDFDEFEDEFEDDSKIVVEKTTQLKQKPYNIYGDISFFTSYNYAHNSPQNSISNDFRGFSSAKLSSDVTAEYKFKNNYKIKTVFKVYKDLIFDIKDNNYKTIPKDYDQEADINELYIQGSLNSTLDFKVGKQIVVWGKSDNIRITDVLNRLDMRTPALTDIKDLRLGRVMSKLDKTNDNWTYSVILLHEQSFSKMPQYGSDFAPANEIVANSIIADEPSNSIDNTGYALSLSGNLQAQDIAFYFVDDYKDNTLYKMKMLGFAYNKVLDSYLFKIELAYLDDNSLNIDPTYYNTLVGVEYNGIKDGSISLEIADKEKIHQYAMRFTQNYMNDTLDFTLLYYLEGDSGKDGGYVRSWFDYDLNDKVALTFGVVDYIDGDSAKFQMIKDNDRVFGSIKYSF
jgi:hypothetical protein